MWQWKWDEMLLGDEFFFWARGAGKWLKDMFHNQIQTVAWWTWRVSHLSCLCKGVVAFLMQKSTVNRDPFQQNNSPLPLLWICPRDDAPHMRSIMDILFNSHLCADQYSVSECCPCRFEEHWLQPWCKRFVGVFFSTLSHNQSERSEM